MNRYVRFPEKEFIGMKFNHVTVLSRNNDKKSKPPYLLPMILTSLSGQLFSAQ